jgi:hypothetical protein
LGRPREKPVEIDSKPEGFEKESSCGSKSNDFEEIFFSSLNSMSYPPHFCQKQGG